jgi:hypothetical protein
MVKVKFIIRGGMKEDKGFVVKLKSIQKKIKFSSSSIYNY